MLAVVTIATGSIHANQRDFPTTLPFLIATFAAVFGIWKTARYECNIARGCEITVTTAEAKAFPYMIYFASALLTMAQNLGDFSG